MLTKRSIIIKTLQVASSTLVSRLLGIIREVLLVSFMGATDLSDAFLTAFKIPNSLRRVFAEGALSAALIPTVVSTIKKTGREGVSRLITIAFVFFEGIVLTLCALAIVYAEPLIRSIAPGFSESQVHKAAPFLQIMMPFIFFISSSALLAGALQGVGHFLVPSLGSIILNCIFIGSISLCLYYKLSVTYLCVGIVFAGFIQFFINLITYNTYGFCISKFTKDDIRNFGHVFTKFLGSLLSVSIMEISFFIDTSFASYLPKGSISLIYYANRFMNIPLGVFAIAFSTIMLSHFSRIYNEEREKVVFYVMEAFKLVFWVTIPISVFMSFFSYDIFYTIFLSEKFTITQVSDASIILIAFIAGLFFFSLNKIVLNVYYAHHDTLIPGLIASISTLLNVVLNYVFIAHFQAVGIALATTISTGILQTILLFAGLRRYHGIVTSLNDHVSFIVRYIFQLIVTLPLFFIIFYCIRWCFSMTSYEHLFLKTVFLWVWIMPLIAAFFALLFKTRHTFGINAYFLGDE